MLNVQFAKKKTSVSNRLAAALLQQAESTIKSIELIPLHIYIYIYISQKTVIKSERTLRTSVS